MRKGDGARSHTIVSEEKDDGIVAECDEVERITQEERYPIIFISVPCASNLSIMVKKGG